MTLIEYNNNVRSRTTYHLPVIYGEKDITKKELYSYTIFENNIAKEVCFKSKTLIIYKFDEDNFISSLEEYKYPNNILRKLKFELIEREDDYISFTDWTPGNGTGNLATYKFDEINKRWNFSFLRVDSFLGYHISGHVFFNDMGVIEEEHHYKKMNSKTKVLDKIFLHTYEYYDSKLDGVARYVIEKGWNMPNKMKAIILKQGAF